MVPSAPLRFSTTTGWPSDFPITSLRSRATMSFRAPGAKGTMTVMGRDGKVSAKAVRDTAGSATAPATMVKICRR
jgi:hypothetical protein